MPARAESASDPVPGLGEKTTAPMPKADDPNLPGRVERKKKKAAYDKWASTIAGANWRHFSVSGFWGTMGPDASLASGAVHWDPSIYESLDRSLGLRGFAGILGARRLDDKSLYPIVEIGVLASNRISSRWRIELGPTLQWWVTREESFYPGLMLQVVLEIENGGIVDRLGISFQPTLVKGLVAQIWRLSVGIQL